MTLALVLLADRLLELLFFVAASGNFLLPWPNRSGLLAAHDRDARVRPPSRGSAANRRGAHAVVAGAKEPPMIM